MDGQEIKRAKYMRGTAAYKFRNRFVFGVVAFGLGLGAVMK